MNLDLKPNYPYFIMKIRIMGFISTMIRVNRQNRALQKGGDFGWRIIEEEKNLPLPTYTPEELKQVKLERNVKIEKHQLINKTIGFIIIGLVLLMIYVLCTG